MKTSSCSCKFCRNYAFISLCRLCLPNSSLTMNPSNKATDSQIVNEILFQIYFCLIPKHFCLYFFKESSYKYRACKSVSVKILLAKNMENVWMGFWNYCWNYYSDENVIKESLSFSSYKRIPMNYIWHRRIFRPC